MNPKIFKQYDSRWGSKPYPTKASSFSGNGCGCCSCANLILEKDPNISLDAVRVWMINQGFAYVNQGTVWSGIPKTLNHYGLPTKEHDTMSKLFTVLNERKKKGLPCLGVILFSAGTRGGVTWTSGGHYIAFADYKVSGGKHYFYMKDSGGRNHDGWYCYETHMKGLCFKVWSSELKKSAPPTPTPTPKKGTYNGAYPAPKKYLEKGDKGMEVTKLQKYLNWSFGGQAGFTKLAEDGVFGNATYEWSVLWQLKVFGASEADGLVGPKTIAKMKEYGGYKEPKKYKVIDISEFQSSINWKKAKADGVQGAIIRCGLRGAGSGKLSMDAMFLNHIKGAYKAGIPVGIYMFTEAINAKEGKEEADYAIKLWQTAGVPISFPIGVDSENVFYKENGKKIAGRANDTKLSRAKRTEAIKAFCEQIKSKGYTPMIYASISWLYNQLDMSKLPYDVWVAQYNSVCEYTGKYIIWQYTSEGRVAGASGNIDMNHCYIAPKSVNPPKPAPTPTPTKKGYQGTFPSYKLVKTNAEVIADAIEWAKWIARDNRFHYGYGKHSHHNGCYFCGTQKLKKGHGIKEWQFTYCCNPFVGAAWAHGGGDATAWKLCHDCNSWGFLKNDTPSYEKSKLFDKVSLNALKPGDVLCSNSHVALYIGDGKVAQAGHEDDNKINSKSWNSSISIDTWSGYKRAYRYNGKVNANRPLSEGEVSERVKHLKDFLRWYGFKLDSNRLFSANTTTAVKAFQEKEIGKGEGDGIVGPKTIAAMKAVKK